MGKPNTHGEKEAAVRGRQTMVVTRISNLAGHRLFVMFQTEHLRCFGPGTVPLAVHTHKTLWESLTLYVLIIGFPQIVVIKQVELSTVSGSVFV